MRSRFGNRLRTWMIGVFAATAVIAASGVLAAATSGSTHRPAKGETIVVSVHLRIPYTQQLIEGAQLAAKESGGVKVKVVGPPGVDPPTNVKQFNDAFAAGAQGAITVAFLPDFWVKPINDAEAKGTPVYTFDIASPASKETTHVGPGNPALGVGVAGAVVRALGAGARGDVVAGICVPGNPVLEARVRGFKNKLKKLAPKLTVRGPFDVTADPAKNLSTWQQLIQKTPGAKAFAGFCAFDLPNLVKLKERNSSAAWKPFGTDLDLDALSGIQRGVATETYGQKPFVEGYVAAKLLIRQLRTGKRYPGWIDIGVEHVTRANVAKAIARERAAAKGNAKAVRAAYASTINPILANPRKYLKPLSQINK